MKKYLLLLAVGSMVCCAETEEAVSPTNQLIYEGNVPEVKKAIQAGADVNARSKGVPVLAYAIMGGSGEMVRALIEAGAKVNTTTKQDVVTDEYLLTQFSDAYPLPQEYMWLPEDPRSQEERKKEQGRVAKDKGRNASHIPLISYAVMLRRNFPTVFDELVKAGADVNARAVGVEWTPLMIAAYTGYTDGVKKLLDAGADKTLKNKQDGDRTALDYAKERGHEEIVALLQDQKPKKSFWSWFGW